MKKIYTLTKSDYYNQTDLIKGNFEEIKNFLIKNDYCFEYHYRPDYEKVKNIDELQIELEKVGYAFYSLDIV